MTKTNRIEYIDVAKGIAILLVILGHTGLETGSAYYLNAFIYSFHLPLFFVLSGYFFKEYNGGGKINYLKTVFNKRILSLIIPYLTYTVINRLWGIPLKYFHSHVLSFDISQILLGTIVQIRDSGQYGGVVWFICWMFTTYILSACISVITTNQSTRNLLHVVGFCLGSILIHYHCTLPWHLDAALVALIFFKMGQIYKSKEKYADNILISNKITTYAGGGILIVLFSVSSVSNFILSGSYPDMFSCFIGNPILYLISATTGSLIVIYLSKWLVSIKSIGRVNKILLDMGNNSLTIYGLHRIPLGVFGVLYRMFLPIETGISQIIRGVVLMIVCSTSLLPIAHLIKKYCPTLFGYKRHSI